MNPHDLERLLEEVAAGHTSPHTAYEQLQNLPFEDLGFAKVDHHRALRKGHPEVIYGEGKTPEQLVAIASAMCAKGGNVLATRCSQEGAAALMAALPRGIWHEQARAFALIQQTAPALEGYVAVVCAGTSDLPVAEEACITLEVLGAPVERIYDVGVAGLHRLLQQRPRIEGATSLVVCAGMEGALPSVVAGLAPGPVIAVPTSVGYGASFGGIAALLGMLNSCATGLTVVNIDNGFGAAIAAGAILRIANGIPLRQKPGSQMETL